MGLRGSSFWIHADRVRNSLRDHCWIHERRMQNCLAGHFCIHERRVENSGTSFGVHACQVGAAGWAAATRLRRALFLWWSNRALFATSRIWLFMRQPETLQLSLVFQFLFSLMTVSCQLPPNHRPPPLHMLGPRREEGGSDGQTMRLWRQDSHSKHRPGARAERIAQVASESNQRKGHEAAHAHDCRGDFRPCYHCTPLPAQTGMGGRWRGLARYENAGEP